LPNKTKEGMDSQIKPSRMGIFQSSK
jgi:hypothetical protein